MEIGYSARRIFEGLRDCQIDFLMHAIGTNDIYKEIVGSKALSFDWNSGLITRLLGNQLVSKALTYINPLLAGMVPQK